MPLIKPKIVEKLVNVNNVRVFSFNASNIKTQSFELGDFDPKEIHLHCTNFVNNGNIFCGACWKASTGASSVTGLAVSFSSPKAQSMTISISNGTLKITTNEFMNGLYYLIAFEKEN